MVGYIAKFKVNYSIPLIRGYIDARLYTPRPPYPSVLFQAERWSELTATTCLIRAPAVRGAQLPFGGSLVDGFLIWRANTRFTASPASMANSSAERQSAAGSRGGAPTSESVLSSDKRSSSSAPPFSLIYTRYTDATRHVPRGTCVYDARKRSPHGPPAAPGVAALAPLPLPFRELRALRRPGCNGNHRMTVEPPMARLGAARRSAALVDVSRVGVQCACIGAPAARRLTEGRSLPGDSTLVCAAYHQFPLILNRIQRTKPAPGHPTAAAPMCT